MALRRFVRVPVTAMTRPSPVVMMSRTMTVRTVVVPPVWKNSRRSLATTSVATTELIGTLSKEMDDEGAVQEMDADMKKSLSGYKISDQGTTLKLEKKLPNKMTVKINFDYSKLEVVEIDEDGNTMDELPVTVDFVSPTGQLVSISGNVFKDSKGEDEDDNDAEEAQPPHMTPASVCIGTKETYSPKFEDLSDELQIAIGEWMAESGIDQEFFGMVMDLALLKERTAYIKWLNDFKGTLEKTG